MSFSENACNSMGKENGTLFLKEQVSFISFFMLSFSSSSFLLHNILINIFMSHMMLCFVHVGLNRCRKSCRLRWLNYLKPNIKRGDFSEDEVDLIIRLHKLLGNRFLYICCIRFIQTHKTNEYFYIMSIIYRICLIFVHIFDITKVNRIAIMKRKVCWMQVVSDRRKNSGKNFERCEELLEHQHAPQSTISQQR